MRGKNTCAWLLVGQHDSCGKSCIYEYCKVHLARMRKGRIPPYACRGCGIGTQSEPRLCNKCGRARVHARLMKAEKKARETYSLVLQELVKLPFEQKKHRVYP